MRGQYNESIAREHLAVRPLNYLCSSISVVKEAIRSVRKEGLLGLFGSISFLCGFAMLVIRGCLGYGRPSDQWGKDFSKIHKAGEIWLSGDNPYLHPTIEYAYPPHASSVAAFFGMWSFQQAWWLNFIASIVTLFGILALYLVWFRSSIAQGRQDVWWPTLAGFGCVMASNFTTSSVFFGGIAIPVYFSMGLAWFFLYEKRKPYLAGVFLAFGSLKPQLSLFLCLFLLLDGQWRALLVGAVTALCMSLPAMIQLGPLGCFESWLGGLRAYSTNFGENIVGGGGVITFDSALTAFGVSAISLKFLGILGFLIAVAYRRHFPRKHLLIVLPFLSLAFIYSHDGDYIAMSLMWLCLFEVASRNLARFIILLVLTLLVFIPSTVMQSTGNALLEHWRIFVITTVFVAYMLWVPVVSALHPGGKLNQS